MSDKKELDAKANTLHRKGALNRRPEQVTDALFQEDEFFDPRDMVQVKYEMVRRVRTERKTVTEAAGAFGMSRFTYYKVESSFQQDGLPGLMPKKPGPHGRHKLTPEVLAFMEEETVKDPSLHVQGLLSLVKERFGRTIHRRTVERALGGLKKKRQ